jgi:hypothetical protein
VLAVKDEARTPSPTEAVFDPAVRAAISPSRAIQSKTNSEILIVNANVDLSFPSRANAFNRGTVSGCRRRSSAGRVRTVCTRTHDRQVQVHTD